MKPTHKYALALEALMELSQELQETNIEPVDSSARLETLLRELGSLPSEALLMGIAEDGLPVLLNLHDSIPGPLLVTGGEGGNKTNFLKFIAQVIERTHDPKAVQFGVLTSSPNEWIGYEEGMSCAGIIPVYENKAVDFILSLNAWAHANKSNQVVVLLLDGLEKVFDWDQTAVDNFRWLLMRGPARRVWPIVAVNENNLTQVTSLLEHFRTKIYSMNNKLIPAVAGKVLDSNSNLVNETECHFMMKEGLHWLQFHLPKP